MVRQLERLGTIRAEFHQSERLFCTVILCLVTTDRYSRQFIISLNLLSENHLNIIEWMIEKMCSMSISYELNIRA